MARLGGYGFVTRPDRAGIYYLAADAAGGLHFLVGDPDGYDTRAEAAEAKRRYDQTRAREDAARHADRLRTT